MNRRASITTPAEAGYGRNPATSKLIDRAVKGETFVIAKAGKPLVRVTALDAPDEPQRLGFMAGEFEVPYDFDRLGASEIASPATRSWPSIRDLCARCRRSRRQEPWLRERWKLRRPN